MFKRNKKFMNFVSKLNNYAFIDSQNLNLGIRSQGWALDFKRFYVYLKDKYKINKVFLFIGYVAGNEALYTYINNLEKKLSQRKTHQQK